MGIVILIFLLVVNGDFLTLDYLNSFQKNITRIRDGGQSL